MIITGLIGALVESTYKWGFYTFGCVALFYIWWALIVPARSSALAIGRDYQKAFTSSAAILSFLWLLYPIAWGLADGGNVISPDSEMVFYGVLDVLAKPVFCFIHLFMLSKLDLTMLQLHSGKFSSSALNGHYHDAEKVPRRSNATGATAATINDSPTSPTTKNKFFSRRGKYDASAPAGAPAAGAATGGAIGSDTTGVAGTTRREEELGRPT